MKASDIAELRWLVKVERSNSFGDRYAHPTARLVRWGDTWDGRPTALTIDDRPFGRDDAVRGFADLTVRAQCDPDHPTGYGWSLSYRDVYEVEADRAALMATTLRGITTKMAKLAATLGEPETWPAYLARVGAAIGVTTYLHNVTPDRDFEGTGYRTGDVDMIARYVTAELRDYFPEMANA